MNTPKFPEIQGRFVIRNDFDTRSVQIKVRVEIAGQLIDFDIPISWDVFRDAKQTSVIYFAGLTPSEEISYLRTENGTLLNLLAQIQAIVKSGINT